MQIFNAIVFQPGFKLHHKDNPRNSGHIEIEWSESPSGPGPY